MMGQLNRDQEQGRTANKRHLAPQQNRADSTEQFCHWAPRRRRIVADTTILNSVRSCSAFSPHIDFAEEHPEIDRLAQGHAAGCSGHHDDRLWRCGD